MAYKIVFEGKLKAGRTHAQTLQTLADMSRISLEKAEATFFSDKPVTVKQFDRLEIAREFQVRLRDAGLVVVVAPVAETPASGIAATPSAGQIFVRSTATVDQSEEPINAKAPDVTPSLKMKRHTQVHRRRLVWVAAAAALLLLMTGGGLSYYLHTLFDSSVPATVAQAEQALFSQETIFLGHVNVAQISRLERLAGRMSSVEELAAPYGSRLLNDLRRFGINPRIDVDQIVFALNAVPDGGVYLAMVILGKFDPERIRQFLEETYETTTERLNGTSVLLFKKLDRVTCAYSVERAAVIAPGIVLISLPDRMADIRQALNNNTVSDAVDSRWTAYRASHLASLGLFKPVQAARAVPGMGGRLLQGMQTQMASVQSVFLGAAGQILPPGLKVEMRVNTGDKQWVADTAAELRQHLAGRTAGKSRVVPLFMDRLVVDEVPGQLTAALTLDQGLVAAANEISNEGWGAFMSVDSGSPGSRPPEEMVDTDAGPYPAEVDLADLPAYESRHGERYAWRSGPLAATVHAVRLTPGELVEIELRITGRQIPNVPDADIGGSGTVAITAVTDRQGKALLRDEYCGREINSEPAVLKKSDGPAEIQAFKTIRLKSGVPLAAVAAIKARIALDIATRTQTRVLAIPLQDPVIKTDGFYLRFKQVRGGTVDYVVSGDRSRLLSIRGLNAARRYLRSTGAASF
ncbi:MAG: hypothetical protein HKP58_07025, partial [Desulfatitalea sp.]|nr:hypothetical protein [Desulfatitalea sp.]NNK00149.1 hypothetical protein [Desulfatitalea sp.]